MNKLDANKSGKIFIGAFISLLVFQVVILVLNIQGDTLNWVFAFGGQLIFAGAAGAGCAYYKVNIAELSGIRRTLSIKQIFGVILIAALSIVAFVPIAVIFLKLIAKLGYNFQPQYGDFVSTSKVFLLGIVALAILPAIGEELLFRVNMVSGFKRSGYIFAILSS
ncbi:MAG: hypothetical protein EOM87_08260, partial [Clostridia bacterium]|nr:hypothetical protein [Clostridia bacterium]